MRPRVLHVYKDYYPPVMGGVERTINLLAHGTKDEYDVRVLVNSGTRTTSTSIVEGIHVTKVAEFGRLASAPLSPQFISAVRAAAHSSDILHFHHPNPTGDVAYLLSDSRVPAVMTYHSDIVRQRAAMAVYSHVQQRMMNACRVIMPTSPNYLESSPWLTQFKEKCDIVPLGIDVTRLDSTPAVDGTARALRSIYKGPVIGFVGRLRYYKGLHFLIQAMRQVDATLLIVGSGRDMGRLQKEAARAGVAQKCQFLGDLSEEQMVGVLHACDVFCLPSHLRSEAFGLSQLEAMAAGLPVVSCDLPTGVPFVNRTGETGITVEPGSAGALADALNTLLKNETLRSSMAAAAKHRARTYFTAERMCLGVKDVYRRVLAGVSPPSR